jgi:5-formyltetrahydrofolate cyclo-ligase
MPDPESSAPALDKQGVRAHVRRAVAALEPAARAQASLLVCAQSGPLLPMGPTLGFSPLPDEVDIGPTLRALAGAGRLALPRVVGREIAAHWVPELGRLVLGAFGVREPASTMPEIAPEHLAAVLVPGVAFGRDGARLGRGGGFYDRLLARCPRALRIGVAFEVQLLDTLPTESHDEAVDVVVTEAGVIHCPERRG